MPYSTTMPFGKYCGEPLSAIPAPYLRWLLSLSDLDVMLRHEVKAELASRSGSGQSSSNRSKSMIDPETLIATWFRRASLRWHPDRTSGNTAAMQVVNECRELLESVIREATSCR